MTLDAALPLAAATVLVALAVDRLLGEPPTWAHPVVGMGRLLGACGTRLLALPPRAALWAGAAAWGLGALLCMAVAALVMDAVWRLAPAWAAPLLAGLLLKPLLSWRLLHDEVAAVEAALARSLDEGRTRLSRLVSRDTTALDAAQVREAAIETLAENLNDSVVAPLAWFVLGGLPGAALYRWANTADAMWGYRGRWEWAGKFAARADDALSWGPARLSAALLCAAAGRWPGLTALRAQARRTPSPNGGWPMGAMALLLGCRLAKPGVYQLNDGGRAPQPADTARALALAGRAVALQAALAAAVLALGAFA